MHLIKFCNAHEIILICSDFHLDFVSCFVGIAWCDFKLVLMVIVVMIMMSMMVVMVVVIDIL